VVKQENKLLLNGILGRKGTHGKEKNNNVEVNTQNHKVVKYCLNLLSMVQRPFACLPLLLET